MKKRILLLICIAVFAMKNQAQTVTDYDGNVYDTVKIGTQVWLLENIKVTHYRNGDIITNIKDFGTWRNSGSGARCYYNNDSITYASVYGVLYNWYAVNDSRNIAPVGWHVPSNAEWLTLINYLGGDSVAGGKLKEIGFTHWQSPNTGATNQSGFTALPGGGRGFETSYSRIDSNASWWCSTVYPIEATLYGVAYNFKYSYAGSTSRACGTSIRCVKDVGSQINEFMNKIEIEINPNPATDKITIKCANVQNLSLCVCNIVGQLVLQKELNKNKNEIDISSFPTGMYIIIVTGADWTVQKKIIKE